MKIAILDDYQDAVRTLDCFAKLQGHDVTVWNDHTQDVDTLAQRLQDTAALVLIRERTPIHAPLIARLPKLKQLTLMKTPVTPAGLARFRTAKPGCQITTDIK